MLRPRRPPRVVELKALIAEVGPAVAAALGGLQALRGLAELAHDGHAAQTDRVPVPAGAGGGQNTMFNFGLLGRTMQNYLSKFATASLSLHCPFNRINKCDKNC